MMSTGLKVDEVLEVGVTVIVHRRTAKTVVAVIADMDETRHRRAAAVETVTFGLSIVVY